MPSVPYGRPPPQKKNWESSPKCVYPPTPPGVFVRFGRTKGEIWVEKDDFEVICGGLDLVWESATQPTNILENFPKKSFILDGSP